LKDSPRDCSESVGWESVASCCALPVRRGARHAGHRRRLHEIELNYQPVCPRRWALPSDWTQGSSLLPAGKSTRIPASRVMAPGEDDFFVTLTGRTPEDEPYEAREFLSLT
jgi:hypothetical protein